MELLLILAIAGGLIWLLASGSKNTGSKKPVTKQPATQANDHQQDPPTKD